MADAAHRVQSDLPSPESVDHCCRLLLDSQIGLRPYFSDSSVSIYKGDCQRVLRFVADDSIDFVLTDPPYLVGYRGRWCSDWDSIAGDLESSWVIPAFSEIWRILKPNSFCLTFYGWPHVDLFLGVWKLIGFRPVSHLVCVKNNIGLGHYSRGQHESAYLLAKGAPELPESAISDVFSWERESHTYHPTQKPLSSISQMILAFTSEDALIVDPFMGGGTTLVAARNVGRRAVGIEVEEHYCERAVERLSQQLFDFRPNPLPASYAAPSLFADDETTPGVVGDVCE